MKLSIFGSTGPTGQELVKQALQKDYQVSTLVRSPSGLVHPQLTVIKGDLFDVETVVGVIKNSKAVISVLGVAPTLFEQKATTVYSKNAAVFIKAMHELAINRLIFCTSVGVEDDPNEKWFYKHVLKPFILQKSYDDMQVAETLITQSNLDWTLVRPARLTDQGSSAKLRVSEQFRPTGGTQISRVDLASFMINQVASTEWVHRTPTLAY